MYQLYTNPQAEDAVTPIPQITLLEYGVTDKTANISAKCENMFQQIFQQNGNTE